MKRNVFSLHSALPPEELKRRLAWETAVENEQYRKRFKIVLRWKGEYAFTFRTVEYTCGSGAYRSASAERRGTSLNVGLGESWSAAFSPVFCGRILLDGDGSTICGYFQQPLWAWLVFIGGIYGFGFIPCAVTGQYWIYAIVLALGIPMFRCFLFPDRTKAAGELWDVLEYVLAFIETEQKQEIEKE